MTIDTVLSRHILITGASSGLGGGLARSYAAPGVTLSLIGRDAERLERTAQDCRPRGAAVTTGQFDVGLPQPMGDWIMARDDAQPITLAIACAGISAGPAADGAPEGLALASRQIQTNLLGTIHTIEPLLPRMLARAKNGQNGHVAMVASVAGLRGLPYCPGYSASKAGIRVYGDGLRALLEPSGVRVSVVLPGFFDTPMTDRFMGDKPGLMSLPQAVAIVRRGLDRGRRRIMFPRLLALGLQITDILPAWAGDAILRRVRFHIVPPS